VTEEHSGSKYHRKIYSCSVIEPGAFVTADVYNVLVGFGVTCPARQHAIKKLLCAGLRGKGDEKQDLSEAIDAVKRAIELLEN
jgi:hypothetical protein